jgi:hypothetical protein
MGIAVENGYIKKTRGCSPPVPCLVVLPGHVRRPAGPGAARAARALPWMVGLTGVYLGFQFLLPQRLPGASVSCSGVVEGRWEVGSSWLCQCWKSLFFAPAPFVYQLSTCR